MAIYGALRGLRQSNHAALRVFVPGRPHERSLPGVDGGGLFWPIAGMRTASTGVSTPHNEADRTAGIIGPSHVCFACAAIRQRPVALFLTILLLNLFLFGCTRSGPPTCLPTDGLTKDKVLGPYFTEEQPSARMGEASRPDSMYIYMDGSLSMAGFAVPEPETRGNSSYKKSLGEVLAFSTKLPSYGPESHGIFKFGTDIKEISEGEVYFAVDPDGDFYHHCGNEVAAPGKKKCNTFNQKSRLDLVLGKVLDKATSPRNTEVKADSPREERGGVLSVIVTDLFLRRDHVEGQSLMGPGVIVEGLLKKALRKDIAVGLVGIKARFEGDIYDLPYFGDRQTSTRHEGYRSFFILALGQRAVVASFLAHLLRSLETALTPGQDFHADLFSPTLDAGPFYKGRLERTTFDNDTATIGLLRPEVLIRSDQAEAITSVVVKDARELSIEFERPPTAKFVSPPTTKMRVERRLWRWSEKGPDCCDAGCWTPLPDEAKRIVITEDGDTLRVSIDNDSLGYFAARTTYLLVGKAMREVSSEIQPLPWLDEWGFDGTDVARVLKEANASQKRDKDYHFPTLNIHRMYSVLADAQLRAQRSKSEAGSATAGVVALAFRID